MSRITLLVEAEKDWEQSYIVRFSSAPKPPLITMERHQEQPGFHLTPIWGLHEQIKSVSIKVDAKSYVVQMLSEPPAHG